MRLTKMQRHLTAFESGSCPSDGRNTVSRITGPRRLRGGLARRLALLHLEPPAPPDSATRKGDETGYSPHIPAGSILSPCCPSGRQHTFSFGCGGTSRSFDGDGTPDSEEP